MAVRFIPFATRLEPLQQELRYAARRLWQSFGLTTTIVVTLALAIGANSALFSLLDRLLLTPPFGITDPGHLRRLYVRNTYAFGAVTRDVFGYRELAQLDSGLSAVAQLAAYTPPDSIQIGDRSAGRIGRVEYATATYFGLIGVRPALGRFFTTAEAEMDASSNVAVISHSLWQRLFSGRSSVIADTLLLDGERFIVIGVVPKGFGGVDVDGVDVWLPLGAMRHEPLAGQPWYTEWRSGHYFRILVRESSGPSDAAIVARATLLRRRGGAGEPRIDTTTTALTGPILSALGPSGERPQEISISTRISAVVLIVLLIACANVANLLLARTTQRRFEIALRLALGISRRRLIGQLMAESVLLALIAGAAALLVGWVAGTALRAALFPAINWIDGPVSGRVVVFTAVVALGTGILAGLAPALQAARPDLNKVLKSGQEERGYGPSSLRAVLIVTQVALSVVLLAGAGVFVRSLSSIRNIDLGYDAERLVFARVIFRDPACNCPSHSANERAPELSVALATAAERLSQRSDVENAALASSAPMQGYATTMVHVPGTDTIPRLNGEEPAVTAVSPNYFATTGVRLQRGRLFTAADNRGAPPVTIVNETMAKAVWLGASALGKCLMFFRGPTPCYTVIGVVTDGHRIKVLEPQMMQYYIPLAQTPQGREWTNELIIRTLPSRTAIVAQAAKRELATLLPDAEPRVIALTQLVTPQLRPWRLGAILFAVFGLLALFVATLGVYSVVAFRVRQRRHEIGVRLALGAQAGDLIRLVVGNSIKTVALGVVAGIAATLLLGTTVAALLYDTSPHDPMVLAAVGITLLAAATLASLAPARWATHLDPSEVLRAQ